MAELLSPLGPSAVFLAEHSGRPSLVDELGARTHRQELARVAHLLAEKLQTARFACVPCDCATGPRLAFGVRLPFETMGAILGGLVLPNGESTAQLEQMVPTLIAVGRLAWSAIEKHQEVERMQARKEQLRAEHETLRAAHSKALAQATSEHHKRVEAEREYSRRLEKEVERRSAALREAVEDARKQSEQLRAYALALEQANLAHEQLTEAANAANRAKSEFLANISHEVRTPMTAILGHVDLLAEKLAGNGRSTEADGVAESLAIIRRSGEHLLEMLNDILDLAKVEAGKLKVERIGFSLARLIGDIRTLMEVRTVQKGLSLSIELPDHVPDWIVTDPMRLKQILLNLIGNAIKFTDQGVIRIVVDFNIADAGSGMLTIEVIDTGIGISKDELERLFEPFVQADTSTARRFGGTGLGLAICRRLASLLGGEISAESQPGQGSTFRVTLPVDLADAETKPSTAAEPTTAEDAGTVVDPGPPDGAGGTSPACASPPAPGNGLPPTCEAAERNSAATLPRLSGSILLVEDSGDNQRIITTVLRKAGAEVTLAGNGQAAIEQVCRRQSLSEPPFDLILMDIQMPVLDGHRATRILRDRGCTIPIVALTANADDTDRQQCFESGCNDYVTKPIDREQFLTVLAKYVGASDEGLAQG